MKRTFTLLAAALATTAAAQKPYHRDLAVLEVNREAPRTEFVEFASRDEALTRPLQPRTMADAHQRQFLFHVSIRTPPMRYASFVILPEARGRSSPG